MQLPQVTVAIPAYNSEKTIRDTLNSILDQTYLNIQVIVSDNYSTDRTREIVCEYENRGVKLVTCPVRYVQTGSLLDNTYSSIYNWNSLVELGTGELITIYHADDIYEKNIVEEEVNFLLKHPECCAVFTNCRIIDNSGNTLRQSVHFPKALRGRSVFDFQAVINGLMKYGLPLITPSVMLRREAWRRTGQLDKRFEQAVDTEMWLRLARQGPLGIIDQPLVRRRVHAQSDSSRGRDVYRYSMLPNVRIFETYLSDPSVASIVDEEALDRYRFFRAGEQARVAINCQADGRVADWKRHLKECRGIRLRGFGRCTRRSAVWIVAGLFLRLLNAVGLGQSMARRISDYT